MDQKKPSPVGSLALSFKPSLQESAWEGFHRMEQNMSVPGKGAFRGAGGGGQRQNLAAFGAKTGLEIIKSGSEAPPNPSMIQ